MARDTLMHLGTQRYGGPRPPVSIVILTYNEQYNIRQAIESCHWCDDVAVLDSGSTDQTTEIARELGVPVYEHSFRSFGDQRNWAIDNIPRKHQWCFHLDADERFTSELVREMHDRIADAPSDLAAFHIPSKLILHNTWLRRSGGYPTYQVRLFRPDLCRFQDFGHGQREATEHRVERLGSPYLHFAFSKGLREWLEKHNRYSSREACEGQSSAFVHSVVHLMTSDAVKRRRALKDISYRLPGRAFARFIFDYVCRLGFIDGWAAFHYCAMIAMYEYWTSVKLRENRCDWRSTTQDVARKAVEE